MAVTRIMTAARAGMLKRLYHQLYEPTSATISNSGTVQFFTSANAKFALDGTFNNDRRGRWAAYDSGSGALDSLRWNGEDGMDLTINVSMTMKNIGGAVRTIVQNLAYKNTTLINEGHLYGNCNRQNTSFQTMSKEFPVTLDNGDYVTFQSKYLLGTVSGVRLEPYSYTMSARQRW